MTEIEQAIAELAWAWADYQWHLNEGSGPRVDRIKRVVDEALADLRRLGFVVELSQS